MEPTDWDMAPTELPTRCSDCDGPLTDGCRFRCRPCRDAAEVAVRQLRGQVIKPSDVARFREP